MGARRRVEFNEGKDEWVDVEEDFLENARFHDPDQVLAIAIKDIIAEFGTVALSKVAANSRTS